MTKYVLGFAFDDAGINVVLIRKARPEWQAGKYNGVGGKVESFETPAEAMIREFYEEAGVMTLPDNWVQFVKMSGPDWYCDCFYTFNTYIASHVTTKTDEQVMVFPICNLPETISNLRWLIPAAINHHQNKHEFNLVADYV